MAKKLLRMRQAVACSLVLAMLGLTPMSIYADHKKYFKEGLRFEQNKQWDKAAERFALAVAEKPSNIEYTLHFQRSLVNAGIMLVERGDMLFEQKDYDAAYQAYRQAYSFDPTNDLARIKMRKMLEVQGLPTESVPESGDPAGPGLKPKSNDPNVKALHVVGGVVQASGVKVQLPGLPSARKQVRTDVIARSDNLLSFIENLAQAMGLNVVFDAQTQQQATRTKLVIELRNVTRARALEMILKTNGLMYVQIDTRTILITLDNMASRQKYEPLAIRTFYIKNADVTEVRNTINQTLQTKFITPVKGQNALIVRDTATNLELVEALIDSLDKSKAEVLIDVNIYEVSRNDLISIGNQFAVPDSNSQGQGLTAGFLGGAGQNDGVGNAARSHTFLQSTVLGLAFGLPVSAVSFFQDKGKAKLLASTQVHVLDGEDQSINIGQRVPIQTAAFPTFTNPTRSQQRQIEQSTGLNPNDVNAGLGGLLGGFSGGAFPQIQYENVGLSIDMKPQVFEDEVHMKMKISSTSLDTSTGKLTPSFNQRTMTSVARIKDGKPTMIAGVSQTTESKTTKGFPIIGLVPILGRLFATPDTVDRQSDVVITVTPHILRRADITERDHLTRAAGYQQDPNTVLTIDRIIELAEIDDAQQGTQLAGAADAKKPETRNVSTTPQPAAAQPRAETPGVVVIQPTINSNPPVRPNPQSNIVRETVSKPGETKKPQVLDDDDDDDADDADDEETIQARSNMPVMLSVKSASAMAVKGQDLYIALIANGTGEVASSNVSVSFDPNIIEVKGVREGGMLSAAGGRPDLQFSSESGQLNVTLGLPPGTPGKPARGQLLLIVFTVKNQGQSHITLNEGQTFLRSSTGQMLNLKLQSTQIEVR
jgi:general secretion pathway protein D